jgi:ComF family protein
LRASILELKRQPHVPRRLVELMVHVQQREPLRTSDLILPVALHPERERERGFNQALILATEIASRSGIPLEPHVLVRIAQTRMHRAGMDAKARRKSVADAFAVRHPELLVGKRILLIDDVFTTGATASACAAVLKDAGAEEILVLTIARA